MPDLVVKPVVSRRERKQFLDFLWQQYRGDPNWIPPLRANQKEMVNYKPHPFYENAEIQTFLAAIDQRPVGRIAAILNHAHNRKYDERRGFFGFFESIDDQAVADGLFGAVCEWFAARDIHAIRGPMNPSMNYECGLLIDGFDTPPYFMMTYNPPYYGRLFENAGFTKTQDLYAFWGHVGMLEKLDKKLVFVAEESASRFGIKVRPLDKSKFREDVEMFLDVYNRALEGTWGFVPMSQNEMRHAGAGLRYLIEPQLAVAAEVEGKAVGACFGILDFNPRIKAIDGRLFPFGFWKLLRNRRAIKKIRVISTNVVPEYQRWGVALVMLHSFVPRALEWGIQEAEFSWVLESNTLSRGSLERGGAKRSKTYRLYDWQRAS